MNILDIDLDFFLTDRLDGEISRGERLPSSEATPWDIDSVEKFLESNLGLSTKAPIEGCVFKEHDEVFHHIRHQNISDVNLYHIDAHSDIYQKDWWWLATHFMNLSADEKNAEDISNHIDESNFIVFIKAFGWLSSYYWISDKKWFNNDVCCAYLNEFDPHSELLVIPRTLEKDVLLPIYPSLELLKQNVEFDFGDRPIIINKIDYNECNLSSVQWDRVFLSLSPEYTPKEADALVPIITKYIHEINSNDQH